MASDDRTSTPALDLEQALAGEPYAYDFYQALRRLECRYRDCPRLGASSRAAEDPIRLAQEPSLAFAPATLAYFERGTDGRPPRLGVHFLGLLGPGGPLPIHLTEFARERLRHHGDRTLVRFLDVFHHRLLSLFYRAWANAQPVVSHDRPESDRFAVYVGSLSGIGMPSLQKRDAVRDEAKLHYSAQLAFQTRHAEGLRAILQDFFALPVAITQFVGHWLALPEEGLCRLGHSPATGTLGVSAVVGSRVWDCQFKFRITIGPLSLGEYERLLPGGESLMKLLAWVRLYVGDTLAWDVNLVLKREEVPALALGKLGRLGWTTWLTGQPRQGHGDELLLNAMAYVGRTGTRHG